jgi:hypothetical protein
MRSAAIRMVADFSRAAHVFRVLSTGPVAPIGSSEMKSKYGETVDSKSGCRFCARNQACADCVNLSASRALERFPFLRNRKHALDSCICRIFYGEPLHTSPENALTFEAAHDLVGEPIPFRRIMR